MSHRKLDVDHFDDEDAFIDENETAHGNTAINESAQLDVDTRANTVRDLLSRGDTASAVAAALANPPAGREVQSIKDKNTTTVMEALSAVKSADIFPIVKQLDQAQVDVLVKYIYRGMASPETFNSAVLLAWHEKATEVSGLGSIVRVMTDRRTV
ncbi:actin-related protein 2/3 complex subunit 5 [Fimicolochytrium jonesii]|uniref:actin-related protein 2/3 complex subunit 5 n=1 Tax=Fimicolochytrium jonesii TaxID=1396493 RepID=UPI0022FE9B57|nr:actin-related protein 2/3 complex subunit 5 [Fimicolochytrium jonesii]KAI8825589.1 actin-related protein 2/3 complex subunit 5 [Fimicolochytrium jonesii]